MQNNSMTEIIYDYFVSRISFGYFVRGDRLPSISYICRQFQVSALTVRTVLARLKAEGYIVTTERKMSTVIYKPDDEAMKRYRQSFLARREGMEDIRLSSGLLFIPIARAYFQEQDAASLRRIRSQLKLMKGHPTRQITMFYSEAMRQLNNPLALNLYWEVVRYLRIPYLRSPATYEEADEQAAEHIGQMLSLIETGRPKQAAELMQAFNSEIMQMFCLRMQGACDADRQAPQVPFCWQIYREHPQLCYTIAARIMGQIDRRVYLQDTFLPSCQALAEEYGVSPITMRRTLKLLGDMNVTETLNGIGTRIVSDKNLNAPNLSILQIRKSLVLFLQALQIFALTCGNVAAHTLASLDDKGVQALEQKIGRLMEEQMFFMVGGACLQFIGEHSPSAFIREVYYQLYQLLLWGHALHMFFRQPQSSRIYPDCAAGLQTKLGSRDYEGFFALLSELLLSSTEFTRQLLLQLEFKEEELIILH